jgi:hypothetical protein
VKRVEPEKPGYVYVEAVDPLIVIWAIVALLLVALVFQIIAAVA